MSIKELRSVGIVSLIGAANAGKSTLVNALVGHKVTIVSPKEQTTRQRIMGIKTTEQSQVVYVDTPGFSSRKYRGEMSKFLKHEVMESTQGVDVVVYVIDTRLALKHESEIQDIVYSIKKMFGINPSIENLPALFVLNKIDLVERGKLLPLISIIKDMLTEKIDASYTPEFLPVSAKNGNGVKELETLIISKLSEGELLFPEDMVMNQSDENFAAELIREKAFMCLNQELPYGIGVLCRSWEDTPELLTIHADVIVEKDSHKGIVLGSGGSMIERIGTMARRDLERIYAQKVMLKLFVRVEQHWTRTSQGLLNTGYLLSSR
jgi:GTPase